MEARTDKKQITFDIKIERELHCFVCDEPGIPDIILFKYDRGGPWYCFSKAPKEIIDQLRQYCIDHFEGAPGYNDLID